MSEIKEIKYVSEGGHFYKRDGTPAYTVIGKNGKERPTTLRDARAHDLVPSVTEILKLAAKPNLVTWMVEQAILAAITLPRIEGETDADLLARIKKDAQEQSSKARERGTQVHAWIQQGFEGRLSEHEGLAFFKSAMDAITNEYGGPKIECEKSFCNDGYGGKTDIVFPNDVIDIKTTEKPLDNLKLWEDHYMQLAAYIHGNNKDINTTGGAILYVNSVTPSARLIKAEQDKLVQGLKMFQALKDYWYAKTGL